MTPASVRWVTNQNGRWGSCTPDDGTIRISHRIQEMPDWVIDYVLLHELAHLVVPSHSSRFWDLVNRQDWRICESVQRGMSSRSYRHGWFAPMEDASADIRRWLLPRLGETR